MAANRSGRRMSAVKQSIVTAVCLALCVVLPMAFHAIPRGGEIYDPMFFPIMVCGLSCDWGFGLLCGIAGPVLSTLFTGMPPVADLPTMVVQGAFCGLLCGLMMLWVHTRSAYADLYIAIVVAIVVGSVAAGAVKALIFAAGKYSIRMWAMGYFVKCLPGLIIQLVLVPSIIVALMKAHLVPERYPSRVKAASVEADE